ILLRIDDAQLARELAGRIVRAADEGAELAELQAEAAVGAGRAGARALGAGIVIGGEEVRPQLLVELVEHLADTQLLGLADRRRESLPELAQHLVPLGLAARYVVEFFLEMGGKTVLDVAREVGLQERRHDAAAVFGNEALAVDL